MSKQHIIFPPLVEIQQGSIAYLFALDWKLGKLGSFIVHCTLYSTVYTSGVAGGGKGEVPPPRNPRTIAKDGEQPRPQPAIRIDSSRNL